MPISASLNLAARRKSIRLIRALSLYARACWDSSRSLWRRCLLGFLIVSRESRESSHRAPFHSENRGLAAPFVCRQKTVFTSGNLAHPHGRDLTCLNFCIFLRRRKIKRYAYPNERRSMSKVNFDIDRRRRNATRATLALHVTPQRDSNPTHTHPRTCRRRTRNTHIALRAMPLRGQSKKEKSSAGTTRQGEKS